MRTVSQVARQLRELDAAQRRDDREQKKHKKRLWDRSHMFKTEVAELNHGSGCLKLPIDDGSC